jgi:hypothetical protein
MAHVTGFGEARAASFRNRRINRGVRGTMADNARWRPLIRMEAIMGRGILLWLLGVPIPIIILLALVWH